MSQTLVSGRGVTTSRAGTGAIVKSTCADCKRTVLIATVGGERLVMDPELIAVVPSSAKAGRVNARRVHGELCMRYQYEADRKARRAPPLPIESYRRIDNTKRARTAAKRGARTKGM